ncbi:MAG: MlaD family protein [Baekduia sp.]
MNRRRNTSLAANPVLIGGVAVLVTIVAVFLSYNANHGLPFVPTYMIKVELPDGSGLIKGNEVRQGGHRVGNVAKISPYTKPDGTAAAIIELKLEKDVGPLPRDTTVRVRPKSPLGLKYVAIHRGTDTATYPAGSTIALVKGDTRAVEIDDFFAMFDEPTRAASGRNLIEGGNAFAGRGGDLNEALRNLNSLAKHGEPAARNLADPKTGFDRLFPAFAQAANETAPVAQEQGEVFASLNQTFTAWSSVSEELQQAIALGPKALDTATRELSAQASFTRNSTELFRKFRPAFAELAAASPDLADAFGAGTSSLRRSSQLNGRLVTTLQRLEALAADPRVIPALNRLTETATLLKPILAFLTPAQTKCNYFGLFFHNLSSALSESDSVGSMLRFGPMALPQLPGSEAGPTAVPSNGPVGKDFSLIDDSFLHSNPYPNTAAPGQTQECEANNEVYKAGTQQIGNQPGSQGLDTEPTGKWEATP